jgi:hypothetical protein
MKHYARMFPYFLQAIVILPLKLLMTSYAGLFVLIVPIRRPKIFWGPKAREQRTVAINRRRVERGGTAVAKTKPTRIANHSFAPQNKQVKIL